MAVASVPALSQAAVTPPITGTVGGMNLSDMNAFLMLFTTQLQHQDPTNPMAAYEMAAQLAQFSTVEKLTQVHAQLKAQQNYLISINNAMGVQLLGKTVVAQENRLQMKNGAVSRAGLELESPATVKIVITDNAGRTVRTLSLGSLQAGRHQFAWDGKDDQGKNLPDGEYTFSVEALTPSGESVAATPLVMGDVCGFFMEQGVNYIVLDHNDGIRVPVSLITTIEVPSTSMETAENTAAANG